MKQTIYYAGSLTDPNRQRKPSCDRFGMDPEKIHRMSAPDMSRI